MRLPTLRLRTLLILVAMIACGLQADMIWRRAPEYNRRADFHARREAELIWYRDQSRDELMQTANEWSRIFNKTTRAYKEWEAELAILKARAAFHRRLARDYREAAKHPWMTVAESGRSPEERMAADLAGSSPRPKKTWTPPFEPVSM